MWSSCERVECASNLNVFFCLLLRVISVVVLPCVPESLLSEALDGNF